MFKNRFAKSVVHSSSVYSAPTNVNSFFSKRNYLNSFLTKKIVESSFTFKKMKKYNQKNEKSIANQPNWIC
jgi:hypothetical protein